jgi:hypothetical protein
VGEGIVQSITYWLANLWLNVKKKLEKFDGSAVSAWRVIVEVKQGSQRSVIGWVTKTVLSSSYEFLVTQPITDQRCLYIYLTSAIARRAH